MFFFTFMLFCIFRNIILSRITYNPNNNNNVLQNSVREENKIIKKTFYVQQKTESETGQGHVRPWRQRWINNCCDVNPHGSFQHTNALSYFICPGVFLGTDQFHRGVTLS